MKVIKPLDILGAERLLYTNALDTINAWNSATNYIPSTTSNRVVVFYNNEYWECLIRNTNSAPASNNANWISLGSSLGELPASLAVSAWNSATTYTIGQVVLYNDYYYSSLQDSNTNQTPQVIGSTWWSLITIKNSKAQFDTQVSTSTYGNRILTSTASTPRINAASIINPVGRRATITCRAGALDSGTWKVFNNTNPLESDYDGSLSSQLNSIAYNPTDNMLVAVGDTGKVIYSINAGKTWTQSTNTPSTANLYSVCYSFEKNLFLATGNKGGVPYAWFSSDGITWTENIVATTMDRYNLNEVIWVGENINKFFAVAASTNFAIAAAVFNSTDGITWTKVLIPLTNYLSLSGIAYNPTTGVLNVVGNGYVYSNKHNLYSTDGGNTWTIPATGIAGASDVSFLSITWVETDKKFFVTSQTRLYYGNGAGDFTAITGLPTTGFYYRVIAPPNFKYNGVQAYIVVGSSGRAIRFTLSGTVAVNIQDIGISGLVNISDAIYEPTLDCIFGIGPGGMRIRSNIIYHDSIELNTVYANNWYDYFFTDYEQKTELVFTEIPSYNNCISTISVVSDPGNTEYILKEVSIGISIFGNAILLGKTQWGASSGIIDYSKKETDEFGTTTFIQRAYSKRINVNLILPSYDLNRVQEILINLRATPCLWIGTDDNIYDVLVAYGFYRDFNLEIPYPEFSFCSLQIEGLT